MSRPAKSGFLPLDRRAFLGLAASATGLGAAGVAAAGPARRAAVEPALADVTANAPGYSGQPARRGKAAPAPEPLDPLDLALKS